MKNSTIEQKEHLEILDIQEIEEILKTEHEITFDSVGCDYWGEEGVTDYCITSLKEVIR